MDCKALLSLRNLLVPCVNNSLNVCIMPICWPAGFRCMRGPGTKTLSLPPVMEAASQNRFCGNILHDFVSGCAPYWLVYADHVFSSCSDARTPGVKGKSPPHPPPCFPQLCFSKIGRFCVETFGSDVFMIH